MTPFTAYYEKEKVKVLDFKIVADRYYDGNTIQTTDYCGAIIQKQQGELLFVSLSNLTTDPIDF